jgi:hypothetical protein
LLWLAGIALFLYLIGLKRIKAALSRARKIGIAGLEIELKDEIQAAATAKALPVGGPDAGRVARRLAGATDLLSGARLLWVDDHPSNNEREIGTLRGLNVLVDLAESTADAELRLRAAAYDLILSDMARGPEKKAGEQLLPLAARAASKPFLIYYVGSEAAVPAGAFGLTTRPDELFHLIVDALSRKRG